MRQRKQEQRLVSKGIREGVVKDVSGSPCAQFVQPARTAPFCNPTTPRDTRATFLSDTFLQASSSSLAGETCLGQMIGRCGSLKERLDSSCVTHLDHKHPILASKKADEPNFHFRTEEGNKTTDLPSSCHRAVMNTEFVRTRVTTSRYSPGANAPGIPRRALKTPSRPRRQIPLQYVTEDSHQCNNPSAPIRQGPR